MDSIRKLINNASSTSHVLGLLEITKSGQIIKNENFFNYSNNLQALSKSQAHTPHTDLSILSRTAADLWNKTCRLLPVEFGGPRFLRLTQKKYLRDSYTEAILPNDPEKFDKYFLSAAATVTSDFTTSDITIPTSHCNSNDKKTNLNLNERKNKTSKVVVEESPLIASNTSYRSTNNYLSNSFTPVFTNIDIIPISKETLCLVEYEVVDAQTITRRLQSLNHNLNCSQKFQEPENEDSPHSEAYSTCTKIDSKIENSFILKNQEQRSTTRPFERTRDSQIYNPEALAFTEDSKNKDAQTSLDTSLHESSGIGLDDQVEYQSHVSTELQQAQHWLNGNNCKMAMSMAMSMPLANGPENGQDIMTQPIYPSQPCSLSTKSNLKLTSACSTGEIKIVKSKKSQQPKKLQTKAFNEESDERHDSSRSSRKVRETFRNDLSSSLVDNPAIRVRNNAGSERLAGQEQSFCGSFDSRMRGKVRNERKAGEVYSAMEGTGTSMPGAGGIAAYTKFSRL